MFMEHPGNPSVTTLLEPADCGRALNVTSAQIHRLTDRGVLTPVARTVRGTRLYRREDVEAVRKARAK